MPLPPRSSSWRYLLGVLSCAIAAVVPMVGAAAGWPDKPIKLVVAYPPGGGTDIVARLMAEYFTKELGVGVLVENHGGAGGRIGAEYVARSTPDGNTLLFGAGAEITMAPATVAHLPYDPTKDLVPISQIAGGPYILITNNKFPPNTLAEFVAYVKARPGQVDYSTGGTYSSSHMMNLEFNHEVGINPVHVPYRGSGPSLIGVIGGQVQYTFNTPSATLELITSGQVKPIAVASSHRLSKLPKVPTISESGYPGFVKGSWYGLMAARGTPQEIVDRLNKETVRFLKQDSTRRALADIYIEPIGSTQAQFATYIREEIDRYRKLMAGLKLAPE